MSQHLHRPVGRQESTAASKLPTHAEMRESKCLGMIAWREDAVPVFHRVVLDLFPLVTRCGLSLVLGSKNKLCCGRDMMNGKEKMLR
jgi:hypothetical protein